MVAVVPAVSTIVAVMNMFPVAAVVVVLIVCAETLNSYVVVGSYTTKPWPLTESFFWGPRAEAAAGISASTANENESAIASRRTGCPRSGWSGPTDGTASRVRLFGGRGLPLIVRVA